MEKLIRYQQLLNSIMREYERLYNLHVRPGIDEVLVADDARGRYILQSIGWEGRKRVLNTALNVRLRDGKIWIEEDWTERGIANDLVAAGVPREDIVLGFQHPDMRPLTEFAVA